MSVSREQTRSTQLALLTPRALVRHFWFCSASISQTHRQLTDKHRAISNNKRQIQIQITERSQRLIFYQPYPGLRLLSPMHPCSLGEPPPPPPPQHATPASITAASLFSPRSSHALPLGPSALARTSRILSKTSLSWPRGIQLSNPGILQKARVSHLRSLVHSTNCGPT